MNIRAWHTFFNSIRFKLLAGVVMFLAPFVLLLIYNNFYAINVVRNQVAASNQNVVALYLKQIDSNLAQMDQNLADLMGADADFSAVEPYSNEDEATLASIRIKNKLSDDILINKSIDAIFIFSIPHKIFIYAKNGTEDNYTFEKASSGIIQLIKDNPNPDPSFSEVWQTIHIKNSFYLLRLLKSGNTCVGAWVRADKLLIPTNENVLHGNSISVFVNALGEPMNYNSIIQANKIALNGNLEKAYMTGNNNRFLVVGKKSGEGNFSMIAVTPDNQILQGVPYIQSVLMLISIATLILMPLYLLIIRRSVLNPIKRITTVMKKIRKGNLELRIEPFKTSEEFLVFNETFNDMVSRVQKLKIDIYEEKIMRQKEELKHLKLQVNPHFFLNSLNIMNTLARARNYELLQEMSLCLIEYFRYMFRSNAEFVSLKEELLHVKNYIRIQELRFMNSLTAEYKVPDFLSETPVPPLIIHTFVENTIKHSVTLDVPIKLTIDAQVIENDGKSGIKITVTDTGEGFPEQILQKLKSDEKIVDEQGEHIGIRNAQKRLQLLYDGMAECNCRNEENGGAVVEVIVPFMNIQT